MKKILLFLLLCTSAFATDWYADSGSGDMATRGWHAISAGSCTTGSSTALTWASRAAGDVFHANSCTGITITNATTGDPGANGKVTLSTAAGGTGSGAAGGGFSCATSTGPATLTIDVIASTSTALSINGSSGSGCNISGGTSTGGSNGTGISSSHTVVSLTWTIACVGGTANSSHGCSWSGATGTLAVVGNATSGTSTSGSNGLTISGAGNATITGDCIGNDTTNGSVGCLASSTGSLTVTGKIIWGKRGSGANGTIFFTPSATNYALYPKDASYTTGTVDTHATEMPTDPGVANVKSGTAYGSFTGTLTSGSSNSGSSN